MADSSHGPASFWTQANALLRKNLTFQKRNIRSNVRLVMFPMVLCMILILIQTVVNNELNKPGSDFKCGCSCVKNPNGNGKCEEKCGMQYSSSKQAAFCLNPSPPEWPPLLQIPKNEFRAVGTNSISFHGLPADSCRKSGSCPGIILSTGANLTLGKSLGENMIPSSLTMNPSSVLDSLANAAAGSASNPQLTNFIEPAFSSILPVYFLQNQCLSNMPFLASSPLGPTSLEQEISCIRGLNLWRNSSSEINDELYKGYRKGNPQKDINEIIGAYDFLNTDANKFNVSVWYNSTYKNDSGNRPISVTRVSRSVNLASNAYLQFLLGPDAKIQFEFMKEMPKIETRLQLDFAMLGPLFFTWVILQLFPVVLTSLVYEKQQRLRIMMKMHGLGDGPYWMISYSYFLLLSALYMIVFVTFGSLIGLNFFRKNAYSIQAVFYFLCINLQVSFAFLVAALFSSVKTASVVAYILVFGTGLLGGFLLQSFVEDSSFPRGWITVMEIYPGFALYRGLYEFADHAIAANFLGTAGMQWKDLSDKNNGMKEVMIIIFVEWLVVFFVALCSDQIVSYGRNPLFFMQNLRKKNGSSFRKPSLERQGSNACVQMEKFDVLHEKEKVEQILLDSSISQAIVCDDLKKVYRGRDGNQDKFAVRGLSLAVSRGECFGMLGPNGAGKTSFINMMIGLIKPSSGAAYVEGLDIQTQMNSLYTIMGVCPQHDLLWETLTGREHLLFYGRLKNLEGPALSKAVEESLKSVNLFHGGIADRQAGKYSGGMKRRLSVAISLIGDPKVVYMDEPSTGLDPASRNNLWSVVKRAKQDRAIILTTHSMEEAEHLCDRLGIFVDGSLQCIGDPKELKARYGGSYVFTVTTSASHEGEVENLVQKLSPNAVRTYQISGTQKFELPKHETKIADVFQAVEEAKNRFPVHAWGLADTTLEDVFIKVARGAQAFNVLS